MQLAARAGKMSVHKFSYLQHLRHLCPVFCAYMLAPNVYFQDVYVRTCNLVAWFTMIRCALLTQHVKLQLFHLLYTPPERFVQLAACWVKMCIHKLSYLLHFPHLCPVCFPMHAGFTCVCATCLFSDQQSSCILFERLGAHC